MEKLFQLSLSSAQIFLIAAVVVLVYFSIWALVAIQKKRGDLADIAWGIGFFLISWTAFFFSPFSFKSLLVNLMVTVWAFRLSTHIFLRNRNRKEDFRYEGLKKKWGVNISLRMFFEIFMLQGAILYIVALPILWINIYVQNLEWNVLGIASAFWLCGFFVETLADYQLFCFRQKESNRGKLLTTGLWSYVRHPNYLGEIVQWWAIWAASLNLYLIISPILLSLIIIKVSGIAPLEEKMKKQFGFDNYVCNTPSLIPFPIINGILYYLSWFAIVELAAKGLFFCSILTSLVSYGFQLFLFSKWDQKSLFVSSILSVYAILLGLVQETVFINFNLLKYPNEGWLPPLWLLSLYPLFSLTLNSSTRFVNRNLSLAFVLGGIGALFFYIFGEKMDGVAILSPLFYPIAFFSWGFCLMTLVILNRKLNILREKYADPFSNKTVLTVFFDNDCPICSAELQKLKNRKQTGKIDYTCLGSAEEFKKKMQIISYEDAMKKIHAIDSNGTIYIGTDALSELYARTDLSLIAILLQAPGFRQLFMVCYAIWAKIRRKLNP